MKKGSLTMDDLLEYLQTAHKRHLTAKEITDYCAGSLKPIVMGRIDKHLEICTKCRKKVKRKYSKVKK